MSPLPHRRARLMLKKLYRGRLSIFQESVPNAPRDVEAPAPLGAPLSLPPLSEPLDTSDPRWKVIEDDFILVWVLQTSHCSASMYSGPGVTLNDGLFTIIVVRDIGRCKLLSLLLGIDDGKHMTDDLEVYKAKAYRLEPLCEEGLYSLDGEVVEYGPIQGIVIPSAMRIMKI
jgi:sphingosine kinase